MPVFKTLCWTLKLPSVRSTGKETSLTRFIKKANDRLVLIATGTFNKCSLHFDVGRPKVSTPQFY